MRKYACLEQPTRALSTAGLPIADRSRRDVAVALQAYSNSGTKGASRGCIGGPAVVPGDDRIRREAGFELAIA
jgi:hypothetical protein